jgi:hypothetical protein
VVAGHPSRRGKPSPDVVCAEKAARFLACAELNSAAAPSTFRRVLALTRSLTLGFVMPPVALALFLAVSFLNIRPFAVDRHLRAPATR